MFNFLRLFEYMYRFLAHILGWWGKMWIIRDWHMCVIYSVSFEIAELSLVWLIPEFQECWWDSIFMDALGANLIGMFMGRISLQYLECKDYDWNPGDQTPSLLSHLKHMLKKLTPFSWSNYSWPRDSRSWWLSTVVWIGALVLELNSFFIIHALHIKPSHWINTVRLMLLGAQGAQAVPEWYEYVRGNTTRIGHNCWVMFMIICLELLLAFQYGKGGESYGPLIPPNDIIHIHSSFLLLWFGWYGISSYLSRQGQNRSRNWLLALRVASYVPLLFLTRRWAF